MTFWAYMLHCRGGYYYTGHTDDFENRINQHVSGTIPGFTKDHAPVTLVWSQEFATRYEALAAERQIKGWSRAKKMALIRGDWADISALAKKKNNPSTSSGRTEEGDGVSLYLHPASACRSLKKIDVEIHQRTESNLALSFTIMGDISKVKLPQIGSSSRVDGLWQTTCFELFVRKPKGGEYLEYNFSPSSQWGAYSFSGYRAGMLEMATVPPIVGIDIRGSFVTLNAELVLPERYRDGAINLGLSAIIEETDGTKSYWALAHPPGKPDFHHKDCFALQLEAPSGA